MMRFDERIKFKSRNNTDLQLDKFVNGEIKGTYRNGSNWIAFSWNNDGSVNKGQEHPLDIDFDKTVIEE